MSMTLGESESLWQYPTISSHLVKCEYRLEVIFRFNNFCDTKEYSLVLPLDVYNRTLVLNTKFTPPQHINVDWNPMILSTEPIHIQHFTQVPYKNQIYDQANPQVIGNLQGNSMLESNIPIAVGVLDIPGQVSQVTPKML